MKSFARWIFRGVARAVLRRYRPRVVAVAGSVGKTGTKDAIAAILATSDRTVRKTMASFNGEIGVPLTIIVGGAAPATPWQWIAALCTGLLLLVIRRPYPQSLVLELGADKPGDLRPLLEVARPTIGVLTAVTPEHMEFFDTIEAVSTEESLVLRMLPPEGTAIVNVDDDLSQSVITQLKCRVITFGWASNADIRIDQVRVVNDEHGLPTGQVVKLAVDGSVIPIALPGVLGRHQAYPIAAALAVAKAYGEELLSSAQRLSAYQVPPGRMRLISGVEGTMIIDDSYNASPAAVEAAIEALLDVTIPGKKHVILGQMSELGAAAVDWHTRIGELLNPSSIQTIITVGPLAKRIGESAQAKHFPASRILNVPNATAAASTLLPLLGAGDAVLVKGSRYASRLELAVRMLIAYPERDARLLVNEGRELS